MQPLTPLWPGFEYKAHQHVGIRWMMARKGGLLCDEMGLGKTIQMVGLIKNGVNTRRLSLLVAPVAVLGQWATVIQKSGMEVARPRPSGGWNLKPAAVQVCMLGYEMAVRNPHLVTAYHWDRVIYDEAHRLASKNKSTEIAARIVADSKWLLTGTPIVNRTKDIEVLLQIAGINTSSADRAATIHDNVLARTMDQLRATIPDAPPPPTFHTHTLNFATEDEAEFYRVMTGAIKKRWAAIAADGGMEKLRLFMRLRQLSLHPQVYIAGRKKALGALYTRDDWVGSSTKFEAIKSLVTSGNWIIFCHFHTEMDMLEDLLKPVVERVQIYSGALNAAEKDAVILKSHEPAVNQVLLVQLQSGGVGLNLQHFNRILFTGPWWTKALMDQAIGRAIRIGQREVVQVHHVVLKEEETMNIDAYMQEKASEKGELCAAALRAATTLCQ